MAGAEPEQQEAEDQVRTALEAIQHTVLHLLQEGETHPQLLVLSVAMAAGQLAAATALAGGQDIDEALRACTELVIQSGHDHHAMLQAELLPVAGNA